MKKAINFDIDTKVYQSMTQKHPSNAYYEIRHFLETNGFEHRQGVISEKAPRLIRCFFR